MHYDDYSVDLTTRRSGFQDKDPTKRCISPKIARECKVTVVSIKKDTNASLEMRSSLCLTRSSVADNNGEHDTTGREANKQMYVVRRRGGKSFIANLGTPTKLVFRQGSIIPKAPRHRRVLFLLACCNHTRVNKKTAGPSFAGGLEIILVLLWSRSIDSSFSSRCTALLADRWLAFGLVYCSRTATEASYILARRSSIMSSNYYYNVSKNKGKKEKKPSREDTVSKPGAVDVTPGTAPASRNIGNQVAALIATFDHNNISLHECREQQKWYKANASGAVASNTIDAAAASVGAAGPTATTETAVASSMGPHQKCKSKDDTMFGAAVAGAVASSVKQQGGGPNYKDQIREVPQNGRSDDSNIGAAAVGATAGAVAGSARQQVGHPFFKDQVHNVSREGIASEPLSTLRLDEKASHASSLSIDDGSDGSDVFRPPEVFFAEGLQAELVKDPPSAMNVAVEIEQEAPYPPLKRNLIIMVALLLVIGGVIGGVLGSQSSSSPGVPPPMLTACDNATLLELGGIVNVTTIVANATISTEIPTCGTATVPEAEGVWFSYETGTLIVDTEQLIITTCAADVSLGLLINVFLGDCDGLLCNDFSLYSNFGEGHLECDGVASSVRFSPQARSVYLILVQSDVGDDIGDFSILARSEIFGFPDNDECENATPLTSGPIEVGSSIFATVGDNLLGECGTATSVSSPDVWYSVTSSSSNNTVLRATTCSGVEVLDTSSFDSQVVVYSGNCNNLVCIGGDSGDNVVEGICHFKGEVTWLAEAGVTYYIRVLGYLETDIGTFGIKVETVDPPPNDICEDAILLQTGIITASTTIAASVDPGSSCSSSDPVDSIGVWFQVFGEDMQYTVSTCSGDLDLDFSGFASQISVYSGGSCSNLTCVGFNEGYMGADNIFGGATCNTGVSWFASSGESFWVRVFGTNSTGPFPIALNPTPENDMCAGAIMLELNQTVEGTTLGGRLGPEQTVCTAGVNPAAPRDDLPGAWYMLLGTGDWLTLSACTGNSTLDENGYESQIVVYSGGCSSLACVVGNDGITSGTECSGYNAGVSWLSNAGDLYYAKVYGYLTVGTFGLALFEGALIGGSQFPPPTNNLCENAIMLISGSYIPGTTQGATNVSDVGSAVGVCGDGVVENFSPDVWYQFIGTGGVHTATTCTGNPTLDSVSTDFDSQLVIYSGECGNLTCITGNDDNYASSCSSLNAGVSWLTEAGVLYFIRIMDYSGGSGMFGLRIDDGNTVDSVSVPENNQCQNATMLMLDQIVEGTTRGATETPVLGSQVCGDAVVPMKPNPDVWYSFVGVGAVVTVSTCTGTALDSTPFDTQLAVYTGECATGLVCLSGNDDDDGQNSCTTGFLSGVSWQTVVGVTYWIRVFGYWDAGDFAIMVYERNPVGGDSGILPTGGLLP